MPTNWLVLTGKDVQTVLDANLISLANQNTDQDSPEQPQGAQVDLTLQNRRDDILSACVDVFRAAVEIGSQTSLSVTPSAVPPGSKRHILNLAAWQLINSTPSLSAQIIGDKGESSPFHQFYKEAITYLDEVRGGLRVESPTDPIGVDGINPASPTNPDPEIMTGGDLAPAVDLSS